MAAANREVRSLFRAIKTNFICVTYKYIFLGFPPTVILFLSYLAVISVVQKVVEGLYASCYGSSASLNPCRSVRRASGTLILLIGHDVVGWCSVVRVHEQLQTQLLMTLDTCFVVSLYHGL